MLNLVIKKQNSKQTADKKAFGAVFYHFIAFLCDNPAKNCYICRIPRESAEKQTTNV
jgi:hypothetical protein